MSSFVGFCKEKTCRHPLPLHKGIFCGNYSVKRGPFLPCKGSWCGSCYKTSGETVFPVRKTLDDDGVEIVRDDHATRFLVARDGDHFMVPFQCELCMFRNLQEREPLAGSLKDTLLLDFLRRANLDAFWSRGSSTVGANLRGIIRAHQSKDKFGLLERVAFPKMGPHPLKDGFGLELL